MGTLPIWFRFIGLFSAAITIGLLTGGSRNKAENKGVKRIPSSCHSKSAQRWALISSRSRVLP